MVSRLFPPECFGNVENDIYRSALPTEVNFRFLETLRLKTVIFLGSEGQHSFSFFLDDLSIKKIYIENPAGDGLDGTQAASEEMVINALQALINPENHPILLTCSSGKYLTGAVVGCLRKMQHWALAGVFEEYRRFAGQRLHQQHEQFVELFDTDLVSIKGQAAADFLAPK